MSLWNGLNQIYSAIHAIIFNKNLFQFSKQNWQLFSDYDIDHFK